MGSVCALAGDCDSCITVFYTNDLISDLSGHHPALDCVSHSDLTYTNAQRDIFVLSEMANSVDPNQTSPPSGEVWSGSALFAKVILSETLVLEILGYLL